MSSEELTKLNDVTGLPLYLEKGKLKFDLEQILVEKKVDYTVKDLASVTIKEDWSEEEKGKEVYTVFEKIILREHKELWDIITHDILLIYPGELGEEYNKTIGHYRTIADNGFHYPEIYQVAHGYAEFLLQQPRTKHEEVKDAVLIRAQKYEIVLIPPAYGVTIINPSNKTAVLTRIRAEEAEDIIKEYKKTRGACYYSLNNGRWVYNNNYKELPVLRLEAPQNKWRLMKRGLPIYMAHIFNPKRSHGLVEPDPAEFII